MPANVKVELINPETEEVVESVEASGVLPDVHKYLSTFGFPFIQKEVSAATGPNLFWNSAYIFQGIMCNSETLDSSKSKCVFKPCIDVTARGNYCTDEFTVTASSVTYKMGDLDSKYGYYNKELSYNTLEKCVKVWEWDQDNGNGDISSIGLTTSPAAITYDTDFPEERVALPAVAVYPLSGIIKQDYFSTSTPSIDSTLNFSGNSGNRLDSIIDVDLSSTDDARLGCYETSKNIVFLKVLYSDYTYNDITYPAKWNELQEDGTYVTRVYYKVVDKKWLYRYRQPIICSEESGSESSVYHPIATFMSEHIIVNADGYIDINTGENTFNASVSPFFYNVEDNAYAICGHSYGSSGDNPATDYDTSIYTSTFYRDKFYVISGDTPTLEVFDTEHCTPLLTISGTIYSQTIATVLFTKDKSVILRYYRSSKYHFIEKRALSGFSLLWRSTLSTTAPTNTSWAATTASPIEHIYGGDKYYAVMYLYVGSNSSTARVMPRASIVFDLDTGNILGYASGLGLATTLTSSYKYIYYDKENPFRLFYTQSSSSHDLHLALYSNFFTMKCNLPKTVTKTSSYKMRVTVEIIPE